MAGSRGYRSYRGKSSGKKAVLAVLLLLVILAAVVVILLQEHIVYDATGSRRLETPWREDQQPLTEETVELDLVIQPVEKAETRAVLLPLEAMKAEQWEAVLADYPACNAVAVVLKDATGAVYFDSRTAPYHAADLTRDHADVRALTEAERRLYPVAQIACFHDPKAANADVEGKSLENNEGFIFYDGNNSQWMDPAKPAAREYLCALAVEAAELGFREILLTDVGYPTEGQLERIAYGEGGRNEQLRLFLTEMRGALEPYGAALSVKIPAAAITVGQDERAGVVLAELAPLVDAVYAEVLPEEAEVCATAVAAVSQQTEFVPVLYASAENSSGSFLIQPE